MKSNLATLVMLLCGPCLAQPATVPGAGTLVQDHIATRAEPDVRHTVVEDDGSKIEELRVRGQTQYVIVTPKLGVAVPYEIITGRAGREPADGVGGNATAVGKRVWKLLDF
jgi:hypothetical protein